MSAYLKFFELEQSPFEGEAQAQVVLGTRAFREALSAIERGLEEGASRICVNGERGLGKTSLARALPKLLGDRARVALIRDPSIAWESQRAALGRQWELGDGALARGNLIEAAAERRLVLVVDEAERASEEFLDHLDVLLSYRRENEEPVIQGVLLARLSTAPGEEPGPLLWWLDRLQTLQLQFAPLPQESIESYIHKHLKRAGWRGDRLFSPEAARAIHGYTGGIPGEVSSLCERLLGIAAEDRRVVIDAEFVHEICDVEVKVEADHDLSETLAPDTSTEDDEEPWTLKDEFEDLVGEEEFGQAQAVGLDQSEDLEGWDNWDESEAEAVASPTVSPVELLEKPSLAQSLEHFSQVSAPPATDGPDVHPGEGSESEQADAPWTFDGIDLEEGGNAGLEGRADVGEPAPELTLDTVVEVDDHELDRVAHAEWADDDPTHAHNTQNTGQAEPEPSRVTEAQPVDVRPEADSGGWPSLVPDEFETDPLYALPNEDELRAIRGSWLSRLARPMAAAAVAAIFGGLLIALLLGGPDETSDTAANPTDPVATAQTEAPSANAPYTSATESGSDADAGALFQPAGGFVSAEQVAAEKERAQRADEAARAAEEARIAAASPQDDPQDESSPQSEPASPASVPADFGWDDLR